MSALQSSRPKLLVIDEVAELLRVSVSQVYRLVDRGQMPGPLRIGGANRWDSVALDAWVEAGCPALRQLATDEVAK